MNGPASARSGRPWPVVAAAMFAIGWGGNQFTPLLIAYRELAGYSEVGVDVFLGAYVVGLVPGLLVTSALSDRYGRRSVLLGGVAASIVGSVVLGASPVGGAGAIVAGRLLCGAAVGIAMAVGTAWVSELSTPDFEPGVAPGAGARRASVALSLGFGVGPGCAGVLAQWTPLPLVLPYAVHVAVALAALVWLWFRGVETRFPDGSGSVPLRHRLRVPAAAHRRFRWVVLPMAPWVFGSAGVAFAIVPQLVASRVGHWALIFTTALTVVTLGTGVAIQPLAKRLDDRSTARAVFVAMVLMSCGIIAAAVTADVRSPWLAVPVAVLLGAAYGIAVVSGLLEIQRIAQPHELASLTGVYYALAYVGFLLPATLAALATWLSYPVMLAALALVAIGCTATIGSAWSRHLPTAAEPVRS